MDYDRIDSDGPGLMLEAHTGHDAATLSWRLWSVLQRGIALVGCIVLLPLFAVLYVVVRCSSRGPFLFGQVRRGFRDRPFRIYKIRTMVVNPQRPAALWMSRCDPEITPIGRILRELKLDELPQLWNVVLGQMQLVGPRPIAMDLDDFLRQHVPGFAIRNTVRPGLTSVAQLSTRECRSEEDLLAHWQWRFEQELECIQNRSAFYDLRVLGRTVLYLANSLFGTLVPASGVQEHGAVGSATLVLGTPVANSSYEHVIGLAAEWIRRREHRYIVVCPVYSLVHAVWDQEHRSALWGASLATADGVPVVWAQKLLGARGATRVAGPTLMLRLLERAEREGWRVALYGGQASRLQMLVKNIRQQHPRLEIVDAISPPYRVLSGEEDERMIDRLSSARPDLIFVGLGCPKQERWMAQHVRQIPGVMIGVGAAFDFHSGAIPRAPMILQRLGLEWAYRLCCEPRRLFWRYATTNPVYVALILRQLLARILLRRRYQVPLIWEIEPRVAVEVQVFSASNQGLAKPRA
jgi:N-acetylglucosaminyldiphosphoundecaprenol N-acetyl-beta-D-mannosaminyltransferase